MKSAYSRLILFAGTPFLLLALAASVAASGTTRRDHPTEASLLAAEDQLFKADLHHDVGAIAQGFADEAVFVHANGMVQSKAEYLKAATGGGLQIKSISAENRVVRIFGDVGIVRGEKRLIVGDMHLSGSYLTVYVLRNGRWQMLDEQSAPAFRPSASK